MKRIWGIKCSVCNKRMFSFYRHDYKFCGCKNKTMVDGGRDYLKFGWAEDGKKPTMIYWCKKDGKYPTKN